MEQNSQVKIVEAQIRECFGRVVWSHKTHEKCADIILQRHNIIKYIQIGLSALTTTGVLIAVFGEHKIIGIITAALSAILFALNTFVKGHDLGEIAQKHSDSASDLWNIREEYFSLLTDIKAEIINIDELIERRDILQERLSSIYKGSPRTINEAYKSATKSLKLNEELTLSNNEINMFLPQELKKNDSE